MVVLVEKGRVPSAALPSSLKITLPERLQSPSLGNLVLIKTMYELTIWKSGSGVI